MNDRRLAAYSHKLSSNAAQLLLKFDERIREFSGVESSSNADEYLAYKTPKRPSPIVYCDRRNSGLVVRLRKPFGKITSIVDPRRLCERGNAFPAFYKGSIKISHVMIPCDSNSRIDYIIDVIQKVFHLKPKPHRSVANQIERSPSAEQLARIATNLDKVYDLAEDIAIRIQRAFPLIQDRSTGEWKKTDAEQCAAELLDCVRKLQVELVNLSQDDVENDAG